jgi:RNA polymerase-interacting CarD/CdnL/TRCF family regulator
MEFRAGDDVVHAVHGVGRVLRCEDRPLPSGDVCRYYVLAIGQSTVWVPVQSADSTRLRPVTDKRELVRYRAVLQGRPTMLERDHLRRRAEINARLAQGSFGALCEALRDLAALGWQRRIGEADAVLLQRVRGTLEQEWAVSAGLSPMEARQEIEALLQIGREAYRP